MWDCKKIKKHVLLLVFFCNKMSGLVNSGLYCYFNTLIQSLSNSSNIHHLLQEHRNALEHGDSKFLSFYGNIHEIYLPKKFVRKIPAKYLMDALKNVDLELFQFILVVHDVYWRISWAICIWNHPIWYHQDWYYLFWKVNISWINMDNVFT